VAGIPVAPGNYSISVQFPTGASTVKVFFCGIGRNGSRIGPANAENLGIALTAAINYGLVAFFMGIGVSTGIDAAVKLVIGVAGQAIAQEILVGVQGNLKGTKTDFSKVGLAFLKALLNGLPGSLGALRSISVRQSTSKEAGQVGYSWQGYSSGLLDCSANARGQLNRVPT
jgi:hypothetical protein